MRALITVTVLGALALAALPGAAHARTGTDPCRGDGSLQNDNAHLDPAGFTQFGQVCTELQVLERDTGATLGGPAAPGGKQPANNDIPTTEIRQCPPGTYIPGTDYWSAAFAYNWDWDFYVTNDEWVTWKGSVPTTWPWNGVLPGGAEGYHSIAVRLSNWSLYYGKLVRVFWRCEPVAASRLATARGAARGASPAQFPLSGDEGDDTLRGGEGDNALIAQGGEDLLLGRGGSDHLHAGSGDDKVFAGNHDDLVHASGGADRAVGADGDDTILTGAGADVSHGGRGGDELFDDQGRDHLRGGPGNDRFSAHDGKRDVIRCGAGDDIAMIDRFDVVSGCEHAYRNEREAPERLPDV